MKKRFTVISIILIVIGLFNLFSFIIYAQIKYNNPNSEHFIEENNNKSDGTIIVSDNDVYFFITIGTTGLLMIGVTIIGILYIIPFQLKKIKELKNLFSRKNS